MSQSQIKNAALSLGSSVFVVDQTADAKALTDDHRVSVLRRAQHSERRVYGPGFSLIEMLVALVILALSLSVLYQAAMGATRNVRVASEYTDAVMLAESMLAEHSHVIEENFTMAGRMHNTNGG